MRSSLIHNNLGYKLSVAIHFLSTSSYPWHHLFDLFVLFTCGPALPKALPLLVTRVFFSNGVLTIVDQDRDLEIVRVVSWC